MSNEVRLKEIKDNIYMLNEKIISDGSSIAYYEMLLAEADDNDEYDVSLAYEYRITCRHCESAQSQLEAYQHHYHSQRLLNGIYYQVVNLGRGATCYLAKNVATNPHNQMACHKGSHKVKQGEHPLSVRVVQKNKIQNGNHFLSIDAERMS